MSFLNSVNEFSSCQIDFQPEGNNPEQPLVQLESTKICIGPVPLENIFDGLDAFKSSKVANINEQPVEVNVDLEKAQGRQRLLRYALWKEIDSFNCKKLEKQRRAFQIIILGWEIYVSLIVYTSLKQLIKQNS